MRSALPLRERKRLQKRSEILQAGRMLLASKGIAGVTVEEVSDLACVSKPTFYTHFDSKDDLLAHVAAGYMGRVLEFLDSLEKGISPEEKFACLARHLVKVRFGDGGPRFGPDPLPSRLLQHPAVKEAEAQLFERLDGLFSELAEKGLAPPGVPLQALTQAWVSLVRDVRYEAMLREGFLSLDELAEAWIHLFVRVP